MKHPVVLVGVSARSAAQSLARAKVACVTVDQFGDQDTLRSAQDSFVLKTNLDLTKLLMRWSDVPVVCVGQWPGMVETIGHSNVNFLPGMAVWKAANRHGLLKTAASHAGLHVPLTQSTPPSGTQTERFLRKRLDQSGGLGVRWSNGDREPILSDIHYQQWIAGRVFGATFLACEKRVQLLGICRTLSCRMGELPFVYCGSFGPINCIEDSSQSRLISAASHFASASGLRGVFNIDFIRTSSGKLLLLEVNPRWSASSEIIERSLSESGNLSASQSLMRISIQAMHGEQTPKFQQVRKNGRPPSQWVKRIVYANRLIRFSYHQAWIAANQVGSIHDIPFDGERIEPRLPCCTLIAKVSTGTSHWWSKYRAAVCQLERPKDDRKPQRL